MFRIHGVGCGLGDAIYAHVDFSRPEAAQYLSTSTGDGGIKPGTLVFMEDLQAFAGKEVAEIIVDITDNREPDAFNVGGPALVALVLAAQLLATRKLGVRFYGNSGNDATAQNMRAILAKTPLELIGFKCVEGRTPRTFVLSDPTLDGGHGERSFINELGVAANFAPSDLGNGFFDAALILYGGTALIPGIHEKLDSLLFEGRTRGALNVVGTVYDFIAEKRNPGAPWGLGDGFSSLPLIDLLVADREEILKLSGEMEVESAVARLISHGLNSVVVTQGPEPIYFKSIGGAFGQCSGLMPANDRLKAKIRTRNENPGDTTGAGDNFLGAMAASMMMQLLDEPAYRLGSRHVFDRDHLHMRPLDLAKSVRFASVAGGLACLQFGGVTQERSPGEKLAQIKRFLEE